MEKWQSQLRDSIKSYEQARVFFDYPFEETTYPLFIPICFAQKIKKQRPYSPLWMQFLPQSLENSAQGLIDPIGDMKCAKGDGLIHRYENRVLITPTTTCPIICRYCFRKNELNHKLSQFQMNIENNVSYLKDHSEVNEVIFTGGDPLILTDEQLESYMLALSEVPSLKYIRFHTRTPIILPSRITEGFCQMIKKYQLRFQINMVIHTNHSDEIDDEVEESLKTLSEHNIDLLSQSVLLRGVNDNRLALENLFKKLVELKVRPYYLHHPDKVKGGMHFSLGQEEGKSLYQSLRKNISGWMLPQYVIDDESASGKKPV